MLVPTGPLVGVKLVIVGALTTVTLPAAAVAVLPAASRATAVRVCTPLLAAVVFHERTYGAVVASPPRLAPSSLNCTPTTPTLSVALAATVIVPATDAPDGGVVIATVGGVRSGLLTITVTDAEVAVLPVASRAVAVSVWAPARAVVGFPETP